VIQDQSFDSDNTDMNEEFIISLENITAPTPRIDTPQIFDFSNGDSENPTNSDQENNSNGSGDLSNRI
jgi:hypothetical protein